MKKTMRFIVAVSFALALAFTLSGCATQRFQLDERNPGIPTYEGKAHFFIGGIGQTKNINAGDFCGHNQVSSVEAYWSATDVLLTTITCGIYWPYSYSIYCRKENKTNFSNQGGANNNNQSTSNNNNNIVVPNIIIDNSQRNSSQP